MSLTAEFPKGNLLRDALDSIKESVAEATFVCAPSGIAMSAMDSSHIALVALDIPADEMLIYQHSGEAFVIGISVPIFAKILRMVSAAELSVSLRVGKGSDSIDIITCDDKKRVVSEYNMRLMDINQEELSVPKTVHTAQIRIASDMFKAQMNNMEQLGESLQIVVNKDKFGFQVSGGTGSGQFWRYADEEGCKLAVTSDVRVSFSVKFLKRFSKASHMSSQVILRLSQDMPLEVVYRVGNNGTLTFYLAPKMDEE